MWLMINDYWDYSHRGERYVAVPVVYLGGFFQSEVIA